MKRIILSIALASCALQLYALPKIAVLDIAVPKDVDQSIVVPATESLMEELVMSKFFTVLDRAYIDQVLTEMQFQESGMVNDSQVAELGNYLGADFVVTGKAQSVAGTWFLVSKMIEVKTGIITIQASERGEGSILVLMDLAHIVGKKLALGGIEPQSRPASPAPQATALQAAAAKPVATAPEKLKVGFIYGEFVFGTEFDGIPLPFEAARRRLQEKHDSWLSTTFIDKVNNENYAAAVDVLVKERGCKLVIAAVPGLYSPETADSLRAVAERYPDVIFEGWYWTEQPLGPNTGSYGFRDKERSWYISGLASGAMTKSGKIGLLWYERNDWLTAACNLFALGVKAANPGAVVSLKIVPPEVYFNRQNLKPVLESMIKAGCDLFGQITDNLDMLEALRLVSSPSKKFYAFAMDLPWQVRADVCAAGPWYDWTVVFESIIRGVRDGTWKAGYQDFGFREGALQLGGGGDLFNPEVVPLLQKTVKTPDLGDIKAIDLIMKRIDQMKSDAFEPLTGPIKDQAGTIRVKAGERLKQPMDWLVDNVKIAN